MCVRDEDGFQYERFNPYECNQCPIAVLTVLRSLFFFSVFVGFVFILIK